MDETDLDVLAAYFQRPFDSYEDVGRTLGMTGAAVRSRIGKLTKEGFLIGCFARVPGRLLGREQVIVEIDGVLNPQAPAKIVEHPDVLTAMLDTNGLLLARTYIAQGASIDSEGLLKLSGGNTANAYGVAEGRKPADAGLTPTERSMLAALLSAPCEPIASIARASQRTPEPLQRLEDRLVAEGVLHMESLLSLTRANHTLVEAVRINTQSTAQLLLREVPSLRAWTRFGDDYMLLSPAQNIHEQQVRRKRILAAAPGAKINVWSEAAEDQAKLATWVRGH